MPPTRAAAATTDGYRRRLIDLRDATALAVAALLDDVDLDAGPAGVTRSLVRWRERATTITVAAGERASALTVAYLSAYLVASGASPTSAIVPEATPDPSLLRTVRPALLYRLGQGTGRTVAMRTATATALRGARETVGRAAVTTLADGIRLEPQITGWQRVTSGRCCSRCAVLAGRVFRDNEGFDRHPACRCSHEPTVLGRAEAFRRQSPTVVAP
ncbi:hypothetical protein [Iamia sp.]|uniref:VG15 protein n=1 Tax=Iamia sp. TaxID=2722710 RepID=UPI002CC18F97|nr:hypothetical protein [Iamia sp.]HXH57734.1 hypothetical protein [Iamia sp.]